MSVFLCFVGNYLTTSEENIDKDKQMTESLGLHIAKTYNG